MSKKEALPLRVDGMEVKFYSNDHMPPHFHVQRSGEWKITVCFLTSNSRGLDYTLDWKKTKTGPSRLDIQKIIDYVVEYKDLIAKKWNSKYEQE